MTKSARLLATGCILMIVVTGAAGANWFAAQPGTDETPGSGLLPPGVYAFVDGRRNDAHVMSPEMMQNGRERCLREVLVFHPDDTAATKTFHQRALLSGQNPYVTTAIRQCRRQNDLPEGMLACPDPSQGDEVAETIGERWQITSLGNGHHSLRWNGDEPGNLLYACVGADRPIDPMRVLADGRRLLDLVVQRDDGKPGLVLSDGSWTTGSVPADVIERVPVLIEIKNSSGHRVRLEGQPFALEPLTGGRFAGFEHPLGRNPPKFEPGDYVLRLLETSRDHSELPPMEDAPLETLLACVNHNPAAKSASLSRKIMEMECDRMRRDKGTYYEVPFTVDAGRANTISIELDERNLARTPATPAPGQSALWGRLREGAALTSEALAGACAARPIAFHDDGIAVSWRREEDKWRHGEVLHCAPDGDDAVCIKLWNDPVRGAVDLGRRDETVRMRVTPVGLEAMRFCVEGDSRFCADMHRCPAAALEALGDGVELLMSRPLLVDLGAGDLQ